MEGPTIAGDIGCHHYIARELLCHGVPRRRNYVVRHEEHRWNISKIYISFHSNNSPMNIQEFKLAISKLFIIINNK